MTDAANSLVAALAPNQGDWLRKSLDYAGITVKDMAEYLDVAPETASRWINGKRPPTLQTLRLWAMRTGVPLDYLKTGVIPSDDPTPGGRVDSPTASGHAALAQSAERFTRNDEWHGISEIIPFPLAA